MKKQLLVVLSSLGLVLVAAPAFADTTLPEIRIEGRAPRPSAAVEVSKARMQLPPSTPTLSAITRIENATKKAPF